LLDIPAAAAQRGIHRLEICSFHLPTLETSYLQELRDAAEGAGVVLQTLLIEDGDPSHPDTGKRDIGWIAGWIDIACVLGAERIRAIAGKQSPTRENLLRSAGHLNWLADTAAPSGVRIVTENWFGLLPSPKETNWLLDNLNCKVGLNGDLGNWHAPEKYSQLADIMARAEICHAKAYYGESGMDTEDYRKSIDACFSAGYAGPFTLIYDSTFFENEWDGILLQRAFIENCHHQRHAMSS
jgi:sugar phosphate isomerase/epimerase